jgi:integrase
MQSGETLPRKRRFLKVLDGRKQPVRGLWKRGDVYYAQIVHQGKQTKERLEARTSAEAITALNALKVRRSEGTLKIIRHKLTLSEAIAQYKASSVHTKKSESTRKNEVTYFKAWQERLGNVRVDRITKANIIAVRDELLALRDDPATAQKVGGSEAPVSIRTANLYVVALRQVFKFLEERGKLKEPPHVRNIKPPPPPERDLLSDDACRGLLDACTNPAVCEKNGRLLSYYLRLLMLTGAREREAYRLQWKDVDLQNSVLRIGSDGKSKNKTSRKLNMSPELVALLHEMQKDRQPDSSHLFPSPQRGNKDLHVRTFKQSFHKAREAAGLAQIGFHDFRHLFISKCVMGGIDFMTIAEWVGHQDGGVLIGTVYGHLNDAHKKSRAEQLRIFQPATFSPVDNATPAPPNSDG